ncbi:hypothetical protein [Methylobacterium indicum]|uniref:Uncharacterized protein n=1 Tax=Methylobacterium indicum TaxID=1775910 RepID=A0A8H8WZM8_9HYPH|nr:hypothetical protein [Methylobacterium indicum]BCM86877.1 hypothetical protein mvi_53380 [Methylobacterium indicum]
MSHITVPAANQLDVNFWLQQTYPQVLMMSGPTHKQGSVRITFLPSAKAGVSVADVAFHAKLVFG